MTTAEFNKMTDEEFKEYYASKGHSRRDNNRYIKLLMKEQGFTTKEINEYDWRSTEGGSDISVESKDGSKYIVKKLGTEVIEVVHY